MLKPLLIGLFVLVVLIAALVLVYASAPQASEITPQSTATSALSQSEAYEAPHVGMAECSDGQDNDGDDLVDWSDPAEASTTDPDCDSARDRSEHFSGLQ